MPFECFFCFLLKTLTFALPTSRLVPSLRAFPLVLDEAFLPAKCLRRENETERGRESTAFLSFFSFVFSFDLLRSISPSVLSVLFRLTPYPPPSFLSLRLKQFKIEPFKHPVTMDPSYGGEFFVRFERERERQRSKNKAEKKNSTSSSSSPPPKKKHPQRKPGRSSRTPSTRSTTTTRRA